MGSGGGGGGPTREQTELTNLQIREIKKQNQRIEAGKSAIRRGRMGRNMLIQTSDLGVTSKPAAGPVSSLV